MVVWTGESVLVVDVGVENLLVEIDRGRWLGLGSGLSFWGGLTNRGFLARVCLRAGLDVALVVEDRVEEEDLRKSCFFLLVDFLILVFGIGSLQQELQAEYALFKPSKF